MNESNKCKALGLDIGEKRIGVAISTSDRTIAFPRECIERDRTISVTYSHIASIVTDEGISIVVVGLPESLNGNFGPKAKEVSADIEELQQFLENGGSGVQVVSIDERFSTHSAAVRLRDAGKSSKQQRQIIDSAAAVVILESWMESQR